MDDVPVAQAARVPPARGGDGSRIIAGPRSDSGVAFVGHRVRGEWWAEQDLNL
jgi:hypothetical protein